ncbi:MAG: hypothetical protein QF645_12675 [Planctomycetota bacterium]|nr:hypothetical protein [Planctomycetota bacterium]
MNKNKNNGRKITLDRKTLQRLDGARLKNGAKGEVDECTGIRSLCKPLSCLPIICA